MKIQIMNYGMYKLPYRAHANDCGADVFCPSEVTIPAHTTQKVNLRFGISVPAGYGAFIFPRSGLSTKGIVCEIPPIDPLYTGAVHAIVTNNSSENYTIKRGERIGQLVIMPVVVADFVQDLGAERGEGGFGSTGN